LIKKCKSGDHRHADLLLPEPTGVTPAIISSGDYDALDEGVF